MSVCHKQDPNLKSKVQRKKLQCKHFYGLTICRAKAININLVYKMTKNTDF